MPYECKKQLHSEIIEEQERLWIQYLDEKKKHIDKAKSMLLPRMYRGGIHSSSINILLLITTFKGIGL